MIPLFQSLLSFLFPSQCRNGCGEFSLSVCANCIQSIEWRRQKTFIVIEGHTIPIISLSHLERSGLKDWLYDIKFTGQLASARRLAHQIRVTASDFKGLWDSWVPVPLHLKRLNQRGFNQAEILFDSLATHLKLEKIKGLNRIVNTQPLFELDYSGRQRVLEGSLQWLSNTSIQGRRIVLVDDIFTTGSTVSECIRQILPLKPQSVTVLVLAV